VHEALTLVVHAGVDPDVLRHVILETGVLEQGMTPFALGGPDPLPADDTTWRPALEHLLRLAEKDLDHALGLAAELGEDVPLAQATRRSFDRVARLA
jgi:3-hydroxyisobutyrate dehydrogenase-like beta-hydroxyacid dehydrogenase